MRIETVPATPCRVVMGLWVGWYGALSCSLSLSPFATAPWPSAECNRMAGAYHVGTYHARRPVFHPPPFPSTPGYLPAAVAYIFGNSHTLIPAFFGRGRLASAVRAVDVQWFTVSLLDSSMNGPSSPKHPMLKTGMQTGTAV